MSWQLVVLDCATLIKPAKCGPKATVAGRPRFVLGINSQLVEIDLSRRLSRIVRNLTSPNIVVIGLCNMMVLINMKILYRLWLLFLCY